MHSILAARTDFSIGESILTVEKLIGEAKRFDAKAVAITDTMTVTAMIDFTNKAKKAGMKPIIGVRLRLVDDVAWRADKADKKNKKGPSQYYATAYVLSEAGMKAVFRLLTLGNNEDHFFYVPRLSFEDLYKELDQLTGSDLALTLGDVQSVLTHPQAVSIQEELQKRLGSVYAALVPINTPYFGRTNELSFEAIGRGALPLVVRPAFYEEGQADPHDLSSAIASNTKLTDGWFRSPFNRDFHVCGLKELVGEVQKAGKHMLSRGGQTVGDLFKQGLRNTDLLVDAVKYVWSKAPVSLPQMAPDEFAAVKEACNKGWKTRFSAPVFGHQPTPQELKDVYLPRLKYELSVLQKLDFSGYFLLVQDVVQNAKQNGILVGPGRGSVGGSLVAYLMGITDCDPIRFELLFERFINPDRIDLPDADLDFMSARRHEVVDYLIQKFGDKRVAGVSNYGRLAAASVIKDISRTAGIPESDHRCSKFVPKVHGQPVKLSQAVIDVPEIGAFATKYAALWPAMERLEGTMRNLGQHAAGIVVGGCDLVERGVIERRKESSNVMCWDKRIVEDQGLVKMDILGLSTLDQIALTLAYIKERTGAAIDINAIPLDDKNVLKEFAEGNTAGIFQFESGGMRRLLKELGAGGGITFDDITAATALYRPGPMESGMMDSYFLRKQGRENVDYDHPLMEPILKPTFGVMVYQEQVMQVSRVIAGYSAPDADKLRKIMGKKLPEEMAKERDKFVDGCVATIGCDPRWAGQLFDKIEGFAGYGFNKSHSVEYTLISYQSMWLKVNYGTEFFAAALSLIDEDRLPGLIRDAKRFGIDVSMPDINISTDRFEIATPVRLVVPLHRIKGIGPKTVEAVIKARQAGLFKDKADFLARVEKRSCNIKHQDLLDKVGAFARIEPGQPAANDASRIRDQIELLPGLVTANVPVDRPLHVDSATQTAIIDLIKAYLEKEEGSPVKPRFHKNSKFMLVMDCPGRDEDALGKMGEGSSAEVLREIMEEVGLDKNAAYVTALSKTPKEGKQLEGSQISTWAPYLSEEINILQPPVIVLMGTTAVRHFLPDFKGKASDAAGKVVYAKDIDANLVVGFNPGELYYAPEKREQLVTIFHTVLDLLPA
jgi:DNA polymerase-3 subunit alpha